MKTTIYINLILSVFLIISCEKEIPEAAINCTEIMEQDGISYFNNRDPLLPLEKFTGSCYTIYDSTLEKNEIRTYKRGKIHGVSAKYYMNGQLEYVGVAKNGQIHGKYTGYHINGQIKETGKLKKGYRDGVWVINNENGDLIRKEVHKDRILITTENY